MLFSEPSIRAVQLDSIPSQKLSCLAKAQQISMTKAAEAGFHWKTLDSTERDQESMKSRFRAKWKTYLEEIWEGELCQQIHISQSPLGSKCHYHLTAV